MAETSLQVGDLAPDFTLPSDTGAPVSLSDFRGKKVVLFFYPKDSTPGCTMQSCGFRDRYPLIEEKNAVVLGISPDDVASHQKFKTKHNLPFILLADEQHAVAEAYGVWGKQSFLGFKFTGITRSHFVIDEQGRIADTQVNVGATTSAKRALEAL